MKLKKLLQKIPDIKVVGSKEIDITGICADSQQIAPGNLFIAKRGYSRDGNFFISSAIAAGAVAVLTDFYDPFIQITQIIHPDVREIEGKIAARYYQNPSHELKVIGITGTNGKTTSSFLIKHLLDQKNLLAGVIGTIEWIVGQHHFSAMMTTPDVTTCHKLLREMVTEGCRSAVMEVSSHGIDQGRIEEIDFEIAVFTNLTPDHLDYHGDMEHYRNTKEKLFAKLQPDKWAIFNADDPTHFSTKGKIFTYGIETKADLMAKDIKFSDKGTQFLVIYNHQEILCKTPLIGCFNVYNVLSAIAVGICSGVSLEECAVSFKTFKGVAARLERVKNALGLHIFIDFAHTEDALERILETLRLIKKGKLIVVFGCGGDRDRKKRRKMGTIASRFADEIVLTNDNPRSENPKRIIHEILGGISVRTPVVIEFDRKEAIRKAITAASKEDLILIAGKGHETHQIFANYAIPFSDREVVKEICKEEATACAFSS